MALEAFLRNLGAVAISPYSFIAYLGVLGAWLVVALRVKRNKNLLNALDKLPEGERLTALQVEMRSFTPPAGLTPEQWLAERIHTYYFYGFLAFCICLVVLAVLALSGTAPPTSTQATSQEHTLDSVQAEPQPMDSSGTATAVPLGKGDCPPSRTDSLPNATLRTGDLVVLGNGELVRLDDPMKATTIASDGFLAEARGVAVNRNGQIFVTTFACTERKGAVVHVDPLSGTQTPVFSGFKRPMGLAFQSDGQLLVGDEVADRGVWGRLYRVNLKNRTKEIVAEFPPTNGAHSIAIHPNSLDIYAADGVIHRIGRENPTAPIRVEVDGLQSAQALAIRSSGEIFIGDHNRASLFQARRGDRQPVKVIDNGAFQTLWSIAISIDEKNLFVSSGAGIGGVYRLNLPLNDEPPIQVWKSTRSGSGTIFVTVAKLEQ